MGVSEEARKDFPHLMKRVDRLREHGLQPPPTARDLQDLTANRGSAITQKRKKRRPTRLRAPRPAPTKIASTHVILVTPAIGTRYTIGPFATYEKAKTAWDERETDVAGSGSIIPLAPRKYLHA